MINISIKSGKAVGACVFTAAAFKEAIEAAGFFPKGYVHYQGESFGLVPCVWAWVERIVLFDDPDSVSLVDAKVWRNNLTGTAFIEQSDGSEARARESAATHKRCQTCSALYKKLAYCSCCKHNFERRRFHSLHKVPYQEQPCFIGDRWFFDPESLADYLMENDILPENAEIEEGEPRDLPEIGIDYWEDYMPDDGDEFYLHAEIVRALDQLNSAINRHGKGISYVLSGARVVLYPDFFKKFYAWSEE
jgi:hypothetical protein